MKIINFRKIRFLTANFLFLFHFAVKADLKIFSTLNDLEGVTKAHLDSNLVEVYLNEIQVLKAKYKIQFPENNVLLKMEKAGIVSRKESKLTKSIRAKNQTELDKILRKSKSKMKESSNQSLSREQAQKLIDDLMNHPVAGKESIQKYDDGGQVGFCFGQALYIHYELIQQQFDPRSIGKVFVIGRLFNGTSIWDYHVAVIARKKGGGWWVLDGLSSSVLTIEEWFKKIWEMDQNRVEPKLRFYLADPRKFRPLPGKYQAGDLSDPLYKNFFFDLGAELTKTSN